MSETRLSQQRHANRLCEDKYYRLPSFYGKWLQIGNPTNLLQTQSWWGSHRFVLEGSYLAFCWTPTLGPFNAKFVTPNLQPFLPVRNYDSAAVFSTRLRLREFSYRIRCFKLPRSLSACNTGLSALALSGREHSLGLLACASLTDNNEAKNPHACKRGSAHLDYKGCPLAAHL